MTNETMTRSLLSDDIIEGLNHQRMIEKAKEWKQSLPSISEQKVKNNRSHKPKNNPPNKSKVILF